MSPFFSSDRSVSLGQQSYTLPSSLNDSGDEKESKTLLPTPRPYSDIVVEGISATLPIARTMVRMPAVQMGDAIPQPLFMGGMGRDHHQEAPPLPPKSRMRYSQQVMSPPRLESARHSTPETGINKRRFLAKDISKLMGVDIDVSPLSDSSSPINKPANRDSKSSSVYSQDSPLKNDKRCRFSWQLGSEQEEAPGLEDDIDGVSSQYSSWATRSPTIMSRARMSLPPVIMDHTLAPHPLQRKDRTHRKSRDSSTLDSYHQFVTELATPTGTASPELGGTPPNESSEGHHHENTSQSEDLFKGITGLPSDFATMCVHPREAPLPPTEDRQGSYFDFDSSSDDEAATSSPPRRSRDRDSFLGSFLRLGGGNTDAHHHQQRHSSTPSPTTTHYSSSRQVSSESERTGGGGGGAIEGARKRHSQLRGLVGAWGSRKAVEEEKKEERRRAELKARISIQGGHRL